MPYCWLCKRKIPNGSSYMRVEEPETFFGVVFIHHGCVLAMKAVHMLQGRRHVWMNAVRR